MDDERIVAYLLGELPEEESERFEEECYFAGEDWPEEVRAAEHDLVDAYLRKELTPEQRQHFEQNYLISDERLRRVATAAALLSHVKTIGEEKTSEQGYGWPSWLGGFLAGWQRQSWGMRAGLAVGVVAVVLGAVWLARTTRTGAPRNFATLTLTITDSNRAEGSRAARVRLPPDADALRVHLRLPDAPAAQTVRYRVELVNEEGAVSSFESVGQDAEAVTVDVPAARLTRGQYALRLFMVGPDGAERRASGLYNFVVE
jgi:hypothetical protein